MKKDNLESLFERIGNEFDVEHPSLGHEHRFLEKLKAQNNQVTESKPKLSFWKPLLAVAATVVICFSVFTVLNQQPKLNDLASVSPELSKTQDFFTTAIAQELASIQNERTPETEALINDALSQLDILEKDYEKLKIDLTKSGNDKRVIYAMISNFQTRIDILQNVLNSIEHIKELKTKTNENKNTI
uniref:hypothetical protein n=2 Tax=Gelidibacter sp. TaxID=2018083 RepID=UPI00404B364F